MPIRIVNKTNGRAQSFSHICLGIGLVVLGSPEGGSESTCVGVHAASLASERRFMSSYRRVPILCRPRVSRNLKCPVCVVTGFGLHQEDLCRTVSKRTAND